MFLYIIEVLFTVYTFLILVRILGSWFPQFAQSRIMGFVAACTDPYLNIFRKIIPPIGMLDLSPMIALFALQILQWVVVAIIR